MLTRKLHFLHINTTYVSSGAGFGVGERTPAIAEIGNDHCTSCLFWDVASFLWCTFTRDLSVPCNQSDIFGLTIQGSASARSTVLVTRRLGIALEITNDATVVRST